ncbi:MAG: energy transducer TonB [Chitinophagales bacterium]
MKNKTLFSAWFTNDLDEIIFESRNKLYGAYELRKHYPQRLQTAFIITILFFSSIWLTMEIISANNKFKEVFAPTVSPPYIVYPKYLIESEKTAERTEIVPPEHKDLLPAYVVKDSLKKELLDADTINKPVARDPLPGAKNGFAINGTSERGGDGTGLSGSKGVDTAARFIDPDEVRTFAAVMPSFPGGKNALSKYLQRHLHCQQFRQSNGKSGKMYLSFIVSREGKVHSIEVMRDGVGYGCVEEAVKVLQNMPAWTPGSNNNRTVNVKVIMPISMETANE